MSRQKWFWVGVIVGFVVGMLPSTLSANTVTPGAEQIYIVRVGDTLSHISARMLGDAKRWPDLAAWNSLKVHWKGGVAYVWLTPGQVIRLSTKEPQFGIAEIQEYNMRTTILLEKEIFRMAGVKHPYPRLKTELSLRPVVLGERDQFRTRQTIHHLELLLKAAKHQERYLMVDSIYDWAIANYELDKFFKNDPWWVTHRKVSLLLLSVLDVESNAKFVRGRHNELGPWQIKPKTFAFYGGKKLDDVAIAFMLMNDFEAGMECATAILAEKDEKRQALAHYNRGSNRWVYAQKVLKAYRWMLNKGQKLDDNA